MQNWIFSTGLPNEFIDHYMPKANPAYSIIYIHAFRLYALGAPHIDLEEAAQSLNLLASDILRAFRYWEEQGLVLMEQSGGVINLEFTFPEAKVTPKPAAVKAVAAKAVDVKTPPRPTVRDLPDYSLDDVELRLLDKEVQRLFYIAEAYHGKLLTDVERKMYLGIHDDLGLSVDVIEVLVNYAVSNSKKHNSYIKTVAFDWADRQINTVEEAEAYISRFSNDYREIMSFFGISGRDPIDMEVNFMEQWISDWPKELVRLACEKTIISKGKPSFKYADGIMRKWAADGVKTLEDAAALDKAYYEGIKETKEAAVKRPIRKQKGGQAYEGRKWDYERLEQMDWELMADDE